MQSGLSVKNIAKLGIIISIVLILLGMLSNSPNKEISFYNYDESGYKEYVGGDAYNIQIEASLRGGEIAGVKAARAIYFSMSGLILVVSLFGLCKNDFGHFLE